MRARAMGPPYWGKKPYSVQVTNKAVRSARAIGPPYWGKPPYSLQVMSAIPSPVVSRDFDHHVSGCRLIRTAILRDRYCIAHIGQITL